MNERKLGEMEVPVEYEDYINLIRRIAHSYPTNPRCDFDDYVSVGMAAFVEAQKTFDPTLDIKLITYVYRPIKNAIEKEFQKTTNALSGCSTYFINKSDEDRAEIEFLNRTAISLSASRKDIDQFYNAPLMVTASGKNIRPSLKQLIVGSASGCPQTSAQRSELIEKVDAIIDDLQPEEQEIIYRRIFQEDTFQEIAEATRLSWRTVNYRYHKSIEKLRELVVKAGLEIYA
jgi:RNA polymerase sigma factor (sigma-70 family)